MTSFSLTARPQARSATVEKIQAGCISVDLDKIIAVLGHHIWENLLNSSKLGLEGVCWTNSFEKAIPQNNKQYLLNFTVMK